jgi:hypothetical protein
MRIAMFLKTNALRLRIVVTFPLDPWHDAIE